MATKAIAQAEVQPGVAHSAAVQPGKAKPKKKLFGNLRSKGVLADQSRLVRVVIAVMLIAVSATLSFTQSGFVRIGFTDETQAYAIILLLPVALGALLLGALWGTVVGLCAGGLLYVHAVVMPLDYYELRFVTPVTSILMLAVGGFILGYAFAFALRNDPGPVKRVIYIIIVSLVVSELYSAGFFVNALIALAVDMSSYIDPSIPNDEAARIVTQNVGSAVLYLGDLGLQARIDGIAMAVICIVGDVVARKARLRTRRIGLRALFSIWLGIAVAFVFLLTAATTFVLVSQGEINRAESEMKSEAGYLIRQLGESDERAKALIDFAANVSDNMDATALKESDFAKLETALSIDKLLEGYEAQGKGTIIITLASSDLAEATVYLSDSNDFVKGEMLSKRLDDDDFHAIEQSLNTGKAQRVIYEGVRLDISSVEHLNSLISNNEYAKMVANTQIAYLYAQQNESYNVIVIRPSNIVFAERESVILVTTLSEFALLLVVFGMTALLLSRLVMRSLDNTNEVLGRITAGDLDADVDERETRELEALSDGINGTVESLKGWIAEAETRMDAELATAKAIQEAALPRIFPPYPDILKFDIYASMKAAKEVGGDFYDFFLIDDEADSEQGKLGFVMADVSGKGVPAALFMMQAKTQIRDYLQSGMEIGEAVENANRQLCDGNDAGMFVTAWVGVLDYATGHVEYVNAGHNPPLEWRFDANASDADAGSGAPPERSGSWHWLTEKSGMPLGLFDGFPYTAYSKECMVGDQFLLYTDGVTEAMNVEGELYGEDRLEKLVNAHSELHPRGLVELVRRDVAEHAHGAEQSDDITILALEVGVPPEITATIIVPADVMQLSNVNEFVHAELDRRLCPLRAQNQLDIAVEELFVNVCHYAYPEATPDNPGVVRVSCAYSAEPPSVTVHIADDGIPYNPLEKPDAVTPDDVMEVPIGGLGILMAKRSVDEMSYERDDGANIVTIVKKW